MERAIEKDLHLPNIVDEQHLCPKELYSFQTVTMDQINKMAKKTCSRSRELDPLPATVLRNCLPAILPTLTSIINMSLMDGTMPNPLKVAVLTPYSRKRKLIMKTFKIFVQSQT